MQLKRSFIIFSLFVSVYSATLPLKPINIPVEIIYSDVPYETNISPLVSVTGPRNLDEKVALSATEFEQASIIEKDYDNLNSIKNLDAKVQLSPDNLLESSKHLPYQEEISLNLRSKLTEAVKESSLIQSELNNENSQLKIKPGEGEILVDPSIKLITELSSSESPLPTEENLPDPNVILLIQVAQTGVSNSLTNLRENIEKVVAGQTPIITVEQWNKLNESISDFFANLQRRGSVKLHKDTILQDIEIGVKGVTNKFIYSLRSPNDTQTVTEQKPGFGQNILSMIQTGLQRLTDSINNIRNRNTTTAVSTGNVSTTAAPRPIQNFFSQLFAGLTTTTTIAPQGLSNNASTQIPTQQIENLVSEIAQTVSTVSSTSQNPLPTVAVKSDGTTTQANPFQGIQQFANNVGQAINNLNPFNQPSTSAPGAQGDSPTTQNPIQQAFNQVGQVINNLNPFNQQSTSAQGSLEDVTSTTNPIQSLQQAVGQVLNNINPFNQGSTAAPGSQNEGETSTSGPIQQAISNFVNQVGSAINNINPLNPTSTVAPGTQNEGETTPNRPLQNVFNQVGQVINNLNPFNQVTTSTTNPTGSTSAPLNISSPLETIPVIGSQGQQIVNQLSSINPAGIATISTPSPPLIENPSQTIENIVGQGQQIINQVPSVNPIETIQGVGTLSTLPPVSQTIENIVSQGQQIVNQLSTSLPAVSLPVSRDSLED